MKKTVKRLLALVLVTCTVFAVTPDTAKTANAAITNESIKQKENQLKESQQTKKDLQNTISDAKAIKKKLEALKSDVAAYISEIDANLEEVQAAIDSLDKLIADKEAEIEETTRELEEAIETEETQYQAMKNHVKFMYERGDTLYIDIMLSAHSFGDFLTKADYINKLEAYDTKLLQEYTAAREWTALCKITLESEKEALDQARENQKQEQATLETLLAEKETELANYNRDIASKEAQISEAQAKYNEEVAVIQQLEKAIQEEKRALAAQHNILYDGGTFAWPCPSYTRITDEFGYRTDPINGSTSYHSGLDLGAPAGSDILCAYDGVVVAATYNWSMGNYVMVDHGNGLYTIYMHASKLYVSYGEIVLRGQKIAAVGTTGRSTGNHLHFGVRLNGAYVSPWNYLK